MWGSPDNSGDTGSFGCDRCMMIGPWHWNVPVRDSVRLIDNLTWLAAKSQCCCFLSKYHKGMFFHCELTFPEVRCEALYRRVEFTHTPHGVCWVCVSVEVLPRARLQTNVRKSSEQVTRLEAPLLRDARKVRQDVMIAAGHISTCRMPNLFKDSWHQFDISESWDAQKKCPRQKWCGTAAVCCCEAVSWDDLGTFYTQLWWHQPKKLK